MWKKICLFLCVSLLLTACGSPIATDETPTSLQEAAVSATPAAEMPSSAAPSGFELTKVEAAALDVSSPLYTIGYDTLPYETPAGTLAHLSTQIAFDGSFYLLDTYYTQDPILYDLQEISGSGEAGEKVRLDPDLWDIKGGSILGMDIMDGKRCVFLVSQDQERYFAVYTDLHGESAESRELPELPGKTGYTLVGCDSQGRLYVDAPDSRDLYLLGPDGQLLQCYRYSSPGETARVDSFRAPDGSRVIFCDTPGEQVWLQANADTGSLKATRTSLSEDVQKWYGMSGNVLYYAADQQLASWDTATGERKLLSKLDDISFLTILDMAVLESEDGVRLLVTDRDQEKRYILRLSPTPPVADTQIIVANLYQEDSFFAGRVASFSKENPSYGIEYQALYQEDAASRALLEIATGNGPDVLYLSRQDLAALQSGGALGDLGQLISQDTLDVLLPGAVQMGSYEGRLFAIPLSVIIRTLLTSRDHWSGDTWSVGDVLSAMQTEERPQGLFLDVTGQDSYSYNLYFMVGINIGDSPFIRDGKCRFDCQEFRDILKLIKETTQKAENNSTPNDRLAPLAAGSYLGIEHVVLNMSHFCDAYELLGDRANLVGYPSDTGKIYYLSDNGMLAVNQNAMEKAGVRELVNYLLSLEAQQYLPYRISVRLDIPESQLVYNEYAQTYMWQSPNNKGFLLPAKEDGSSYLEEYVDLLKKAAPLSIDSDDIFNIIDEEAAAYFQSDKDIDAVIDTIQSRVQLYLDERS